MERDETTAQSDADLVFFLGSSDEGTTETALTGLLNDHIQPVVNKTLRAKLHVSLKPDDFSQANQDALELAGEIKLSLVSELNKVKSNANGKVIHNLESYVISVTLNTYRQYLRDKYPMRRQLKNKLRYLLTHHQRFALWEGERGWICGFRKNDRSGQIYASGPDSIRGGVAEVVDKNNLREHSRVIDLLTAVFEFAKVPILLNDLISVVTEIQGIKDQKETVDIDSFSLEEKFAAPEETTLSSLEHREILTKTWVEICDLPVRHRVALLLNLRDRQGDAVVWLFPVLRIASIRQIAKTLEIPAAEFALVWRELPWEDLRIAEYLDLTRQQVINLRQSARARLLRQVKIF